MYLTLVIRAGRMGGLGLALAAQFFLSGRADAQFMRIGPFDFTGQAKMDAIYSSNVEGTRPSDDTKTPKDYYLVPGVSVQSSVDMVPSTKLNVDSSLDYENHFVRDELNTAVGTASIGTDTSIGHYTVNAEAHYERSLTIDEGTFVPGRVRKKRVVNDALGDSLGVVWERQPFTLSGDYTFESLRYKDRELQKEGDSDSTALAWECAWEATSFLTLGYTAGRTKTVRVNVEKDAPWENTESINVTFDFNIDQDVFRRPKLTYAFAIAKEDTRDEQGAWVRGQWEPVHTFTLSDEMILSSALQIKWNMEYVIEQKPEQNDIAFTYGFAADHTIDRLTKQTLSAERTPAKTFGSLQDTDSTTWDYALTREDFIINKLSVALGVSYDVNIPPNGAEVEKTATYTATIKHSSEITRRLSRDLIYDYSKEYSNMEMEPLVVHTITLAFTYEL